MIYEWDGAKNLTNSAKHGLNLADAEQVLTGPCVTFADDRFDYGEDRLITLGVLCRSSSHRCPCAARRRHNTDHLNEKGKPTVSKKSIISDLSRIDLIKNAEIDYSDIPALDKSFFKKATAAWPPAKQQLTIRLDSDLLNWLKASGRGYQTRINRILRAAMESQSSRPLRTKPAAKKDTRARRSLEPA